MQNSKKERNPSSCPSSFHEGLPELETDSVVIELTQNHAEVIGSFVGG